MPRVVLMAKSTYVWLDQLSRQYGRADLAASTRSRTRSSTGSPAAGFTGLWLIGLWERSHASQHDQADCAATRRPSPRAYSLIDYQIADDLGGEAAYQQPARARLAARHPPGQRHGAQPHGHRLALGRSSTRTGSCSRPTPPYPGVLASTGPTCRRDPRVGIYLEDHYYDNTDAAVVFKRVDRWTGERALHLSRQRRHQHALERHRAARLPQAPRSARRSSRPSSHVARQFPVIRFDAAMTLAKRHIQRLWYPGAGQRRRHPVARRVRA